MRFFAIGHEQRLSRVHVARPGEAHVRLPKKLVVENEQELKKGLNVERKTDIHSRKMLKKPIRLSKKTVPSQEVENLASQESGSIVSGVKFC